MAFVLLPLSAFLTQASASWTGYWTYESGTWVWTWVWVSPDSSFSAAAVVKAGGGSQSSPAASTSAAITLQNCCGITIFGFGRLDPASVARSGLLASDFTIDDWGNMDGSHAYDLVLKYIGQTTIAPGTDLGTMTLFSPAAFPASNPPVDLTYQEAFLDASGNVLRDTGVISSAVPEPGSFLLLVGFLLILYIVHLGQPRGLSDLPRRYRASRGIDNLAQMRGKTYGRGAH